MAIAISLLGAAGKMGKRLLSLASQDPELKVVAGTVRKLPEDHFGVPLFIDPEQAFVLCDVAIDFSAKEAMMLHLAAAIKTKKALVIGTTGLSPDEQKVIKQAAQYIPILFSPNFSLGMALCIDAVRHLSQALNGMCDIQIVETHHVHKKDQPSGTALSLADAMACQKTIPIHSVRTGEVVGEHSVIFECGHERIELKHTALSRDAFAQGALIGAKFLAKQPPGLYTLKDLYRDTSY